MTGRLVAELFVFWVTPAVFAVTGFVLLVLIGLSGSLRKEATAFQISGPYERYLASQAGFPKSPEAYHRDV